MRRCRLFSIFLGVILLALPACGSGEPVNHPEQLPDARIPKMTKKK
ncbi:MAG TPA: hypothetical protein VKE94_14320 [Gemmataceae bacterium]|nr:hypothetical protein [Gemmataceae bacterium]